MPDYFLWRVRMSEPADIISLTFVAAVALLGISMAFSHPLRKVLLRRSPSSISIVFCLILGLLVLFALNVFR